jgi:small subunit ribosomal protein S17
MSEQATQEKRAARKVRIGTVISDKMDKTVVVRVERQFAHPIYKKIIKRSTRFKAHDEHNDAHIGDKVRIMETRPMSKDKRWRVVEVVERAK